MATENKDEKQQEAEVTKAASANSAAAPPIQTKQLKSSQTNRHGDEVTTTEHGAQQRTLTRAPKTVTATTYTTSGFLKPDGTPNEGAQKEFEESKADLQSAYHIDPETGKVDKKYITDIVGVNPEEMKRKRAQEMRLNQTKQKESALYNALSVLTDMITTASGGNVLKREADKHAKDAHTDNLNLEKAQAEEDKEVAKALKAPEQAYAAAVAALRDKVGTKYGAKVSTSTERGGDTAETVTRGNDTTTKTRGNDYITVNKEVAIPTGSGKGKGSGSGGSGQHVVMSIAKRDKEGKNIGYSMHRVPVEYANAYMGQLQNTIQQLITENNSLPESRKDPKVVGMEKSLTNQGVLKINKDGEYEWIKDPQRFYNLTNTYQNVDRRLDLMLKDIWDKFSETPITIDEENSIEHTDSAEGWGEVTPPSSDNYDF